jgi:hypothetical protein
VQGRELGQLLQLGEEAVVDDNGLAKAVAAVDDAVRHGLEAGRRVGERLEFLRSPVVVDNGQLQARRAGVDD